MRGPLEVLILRGGGEGPDGAGVARVGVRLIIIVGRIRVRGREGLVRDREEARSIGQPVQEGTGVGARRRKEEARSRTTESAERRQARTVECRAVPTPAPINGRPMVHCEAEEKGQGKRRKSAKSAAVTT